jgi:hypothetical protein
MRSLVVGFIFLILSINIYGCRTWKPYPITSNFSAEKIPSRPDYALKTNWAALPSEKDFSDSLPVGFEGKRKTEVLADVFFLHPTIYTAQPNNEFDWNASLSDTALNNQVDVSTILNQASAFNNGTRVFAPRYRQAHYYAFVTTDKTSSKKALDLAYEDVKAAFAYYMEHHNAGRPIIIAGHSQGTIHAGRLLKEFFDGKPLQKQLIEAYLVGIAVQPGYFTNIKPSKSEGDFGGFVSWNTFITGYYPDNYKNGLHTAVCTNPISWDNGGGFVSNSKSKGGVGLKFRFMPSAVDAECSTGLLWINKPYVRGRALLRDKVWHRADINLFWADIWYNVALRTENYLKNAK